MSEAPTLRKILLLAAIGIVTVGGLKPTRLWAQSASAAAKAPEFVAKIPAGVPLPSAAPQGEVTVS